MLKEIMEPEKIISNYKFREMRVTEKREVLQYLRKDKKLSLVAISWRLFTSPQLVHYWIKKFGIK